MIDLEARLQSEVDRLADEMVHLAARLIQTPSVTPALASEDERAAGSEGACNHILGNEMRQAGLEVELFGPSPERSNAVGVLRGGGGGRSVAFNGHIDTVSAGLPELWSVDPFGGLIRENRVWGRGATDMKGALAAIVMAVNAITSLGIRLAGDVFVQSVIGEEVGDDDGTPAVLGRGTLTDAAICGEPTGGTAQEEHLSIQIISNPALLLRVVLAGRATHSALRHEWLYPGGRSQIGVNAIEKGVGLVEALLRLERKWGLEKRHALFAPGKFVLHPGRFVGGDGPFLPAERCTVEYIVWHHPDESAQSVRDEIETWIALWASQDAWLSEHPPMVSWFGEYGCFSLDSTHPLVGAVERAHAAVFAAPARITSFPAGCDATALSAAGIPTLVYGPGEISIAHTVDEYVDIEDLVQAAKVYAIAAVNWCGLAD